MAIAANFRKYAEAMALQLVLPLGKPVWNGKRPTTTLGRAFRAYITAAMKARGLVEYPAEVAMPQWWKDAQAKAKKFAKFMKEGQYEFNLHGQQLGRMEERIKRYARDLRSSQNGLHWNTDLT